MYCSTHIRLAEIIYKSLDNELKTKIRKSSFKYGNIKPDLNRMIIKFPHTIEGSFSHIIKEIEQLIDQVNSLNQMEKREFSQRLGIITHYIADYFCMPHNKCIMNNGLVKHLLYERKVSRLCKSTKDIRRSNVKDDFNSASYTCIAEYITEKHGKYLMEAHSLSVDIEYAIQACVTVASIIIITCIQKCKQDAA